MDKQPFLQDLQARLGELIRNSPAVDIERNLKALLGQAFQRMELVTRDEFDTFAQVLAALRARVDSLEATVARLESERDGHKPPAQTPPTAS
ncbi:MAG: hypothetical protein RIS35_2197 [Pseudomonadota bacterium]|jgi:BMFP domain-containing protein YqiC